MANFVAGGKLTGSRAGSQAWQTGAMHLAQLNVGRLRAPMDDPLIADFKDNLGRVNQMAENSPGYVWRLQGARGNATGIRAFPDPLDIINLTVWQSVEALADFTFRSGHVEFLRRRREFFEHLDQPTMCLWWVPEGELSSVEDALGHLEHLRVHGPTPISFTFRRRFDAGDVDARLSSELDTCPA